MYLRIHRLEMENIKCFSKMKFKFKEGVNVITGSNGTGKSTIINSIGFGLYGNDYLKGSSLQIKDMIKRGEEKGKIILNFSTNEGNFTSHYRIRLLGGDVWKLYRTGLNEPVAEGITETREVIQSLLGENIDHKTFKTALCSRQGELSELLEETPAARSEQIKTILGLDNFSRAEAAINSYTRQKSSEKDEITNKIEVYDQMKIDINALQEEINENNKKLAFAQKKWKELKEEIETLQDTVEKQASINQRINVLETDTKRIKKLVQDKKEELKTKSSKIEEYRQKLQYDQLDLETVNSKLQSENTKLSNLKVKKQNIEQQLKNYRDTMKEINEYQEQLETGNNTLKKDNQKKEALLEFGKKEEQESILSTKKSTLQNFKKRKTELEDILSSIRNNIKQLNERKKKMEEFNKKTREDFKKKFENSIDNLEAVSSDFTIERKGLQEKIEKEKKLQRQLQDKSGALKGKIESISKTINLIENQEIHQDCPVCQRSLENLDKDQLLKTQIDMKDDLVSTKAETDKELEAKDSLISKLEESKEVIENNISLIERFKESKNQLSENIDELDKMNNEIKENMDKKEEISQKLQELKETNEEKLQSEIATSEKRLSELRSLEQEINTYLTLRENTKKQITSLKGKISNVSQEDLENEKTSSEKEIKEAEEITNLLSNTVQKLVQQHQDLSNSMNQLEDDLKIKQNELDNLKETFDIDEFTSLKNLRDRKIEASGRYKNSIENHSEKEEELKEKMDEAKKQKAKRKEMQDSLDEIDSILPLANTIKKILHDTPERLIAKTSAQISSYLTSMIKRLLPDQGFDRAKFEKDGDILIYNNNKPVDKKTLSGGERTILALTLRMALADYVAPLQFLTLDEPTNHLDANRVSEFIEIIDREELFSQSKGQLLLVTHREEFNRNAQNSIMLDFVDGNRTQIEIIDS